MPLIPAVSTEYLYVPDILAFDADSGEVADPSSLPVEFAFKTDGEPVALDWETGEWVSPTKARILVGPLDGVVLAAGRYSVWLRVTGAVEQPQRIVGTVTVE